MRHVRDKVCEMFAPDLRQAIRECPANRLTMIHCRFHGKFSRDDLLLLPLELRDSRLRLQAEKIQKCYCNNDEFAGSECDLNER